MRTTSSGRALQRVKRVQRMLRAYDIPLMEAYEYLCLVSSSILISYHPCCQLCNVVELKIIVIMNNRTSFSLLKRLTKLYIYSASDSLYMHIHEKKYIQQTLKVHFLVSQLHYILITLFDISSIRRTGLRTLFAVSVEPPTKEVVLSLTGQLDHITESMDCMLVHLISPLNPHPA